MRLTMAARVLLAALILLTPIGCWDYKEYEGMALIFAIGFDSAPGRDKLSFTVEYLVSGGGGQTSGGKQAAAPPQGVVYTAAGPTVETAIDKLQEGIARQLFFEYTRVIVIGAEAASKKMEAIMKYLNYTPRIRDYAYLFVTPGKASDVLSAEHKYDTKSTSQAVFDLARQTTLNSYPDRLGSFKRILFTGGIEATASRLILEKLSTSVGPVDSPGSAETDAGGKGAQTPESTPSDPGLARIVEKQPGLITASGMAAFDGQKMVGWLDGKESRGWAWIANRSIKGYKYAFQIPGTPETDKINFHLLGSKGKISTRIDQGKIAIDLNIKAEAAFEDYLPAVVGIVGPKEVAKIEQYLERCIRADIAAALNKGQRDLKTDIFGFGFAFFRQHHREWRGGIDKKWPRLFPDIPIQIKVAAKIINTGIKIRFN